MNFFTCYCHAVGKIRQRPKEDLKLIFMRLCLIYIVVISSLSHASASLFGQGISINVQKVPLETVFNEIEKQSGYIFWYDKDILAKALPVSLKLRNADLKTVLEACLKGQPLTYSVNDRTIVIKAKEEGLIDRIKSLVKKAFTINGQVTDENDSPLPGVNVKVIDQNLFTISNNDGTFSIEVPDETAVLQFTYIGYDTVVKTVNSSRELRLKMKPYTSKLEVVSVVSTGYQQLPKERATGSFVLVDQELLNRRLSTNILERLDGVAAGVYFNGDASPVLRSTAASSRNPGINIRGQSTILAATDPLIVLDNFPYEGEISNINPNDVESITILKDAAAASIWGTKAGNGVIVITTKKGKLNQKTQVELNNNVTIGKRPNLYYDKNFLPAADYIEVERILFNAGLFNADINNTIAQTPVSPVVDILAKQRAGTITEAEAERQLTILKGYDVRRDYDRYAYQKSVSQQYSLSFRGGSKDMTYAASIGRDNNRSNEVRNGFGRTSVNLFNTYRPIKHLQVTAGLNYSVNHYLDNNLANRYGSTYGIGGKYQNIFPYAQFADEHGNALAIVQKYKPAFVQAKAEQGFLDWTYKPLEEIANGDKVTKVTDVLFRAGANYQFIPQLSTEVNYQHEKEMITARNLRNQNTFYTRDLINRFSQYNATNGTFNYIFPLGDIVTIDNSELNTNNLRAQLNYDQNFRDHQVNAIAGAEIREVRSEGTSLTSYGYNDQFGTAVSNLNYGVSYPLNPSGTSMIESPDANISGAVLRYLSYYANLGYTYRERYFFNVSGRRDGSNIFGANTNQKITPLWSAGLGWNISRESFYTLNWLSYLKLRATYGYNGNVYNGSAYLSGRYFSSSITGAPLLNINVAPNPELRWEKVRNINLAIDFSALNSRLSGTLEFYRKDGTDLLQRTPLAAQTGFSAFTSNAASIRTYGYDFTLQAHNIKGNLKWSTALLLSGIKDRLLKYDVVPTATTIQNGLGFVGQSLFSVYSYRWAGLDPNNGDPQGYLNGKVSKDYAAIIRNFEVDSLKFNGTDRPGTFGNIRNDFSYKGFGLSVGIAYKFSYFFRRPSTTLNYQDILRLNASSDYSHRWQQPGDELSTTVPSLVYPNNSNRNTFYQFSEILVEKGDHIRLQDLRISYNFTDNVLTSKLIRRLQLYTYANNMGIIWRANKLGLDPDKIGPNLTHLLPNPFTIGFGLNANF